MKDFAQKLNQSAWKGVIHEVGIGLEFSSRYLRIPGASNTILGVYSDYGGLGVPHEMRAVSLENAIRMSKETLNKAMSNQFSWGEAKHKFGFAITGAHYPNKDSHIWMSLATCDNHSYIHFSILGNSNREIVGNIVAMMAEWFLEGCLLQEYNWANKIIEIKNCEDVRIDVLYAPGISDSERLLLLSKENALLYHGGKFRRVIDYVRQYSRIYPGAFNPPTKRHLVIQDAIFEISQVHPNKGNISIEDMIHRMRMVGDIGGMPVLLTQAPLYCNKQELLLTYDYKERFHFILGVDAWNVMIQPHQYINEEWLGRELDHSKFLIVQREGIDMNENKVSRNLDKTIFYSTNRDCESNINSTKVRNSADPGEHPFLTPEIGEYVKKHGLYLTTATKSV